MKQIYLDYAAATPLDPAVAKSMQSFLAEQFYNPSANYKAAIAVRAQLEKARSQVAHWLGSRPAEVVFTAGGTEANNLAIHGIMRAFPEANIVISAIEHESIREPATAYDCREVTVNADGRANIDDLLAKVDDKTVLVSIMCANNEIGTIQPLREIATKLQAIKGKRSDKLPLYLHADACQAGNYLDMHAARLGVDMVTVNGGKLYGPKQSGCLYVKAGIVLDPQILGGGQERGVRSGTENVAGVVGIAEAFDIAQQQRHQEVERLTDLRQHFMQAVEQRIANLQINGSLKSRLPNNVHVTIPGQDNERLLFALDEAGIMAAAGSACSASSEEPSHVLRAIGLTDAEAQASLRFSMGRQTTADDIDQVVDTLSKLVNR